VKIQNRFDASVVIFEDASETIADTIANAIKAKTSLRCADLRYANLRNADLRSANLRYADLRYANLGSANLGSADLRYANLRYADLRYANLGYANLGSANLRYADLRYANLDSADLGCANLGSADLRSADLGYANLGSADLRSADLRSANLRCANLRSADLRCADADRKDRPKLSWSSHALLSEVLRRSAGSDVSRRKFAGLFLVSIDWCWETFLGMTDDPSLGWAIEVLRDWVQDDDGAPSVLRSPKSTDLASAPVIEVDF
jgi:uncharacterized protein YjbI with pentapeptide repeats